MRRDNCLLVRNVVTTCLEKILIERDEDGAKEYVRHTIADLLMNRLDLSLLVITKVRMPHAWRGAWFVVASNVRETGRLCRSARRHSAVGDCAGADSVG